MNKKLLDKYVKLLEENNAQTSDDPEVNHSEADGIICSLLDELGYGKAVEVYNNAEMRWYA